MSEVKVTEWVRGGQIAWMQNIQRASESTHGKSPPNLSKQCMVASIYLPVFRSRLHLTHNQASNLWTGSAGFLC